MRMRWGAISVLSIAAAAVWAVPLLGLALAGTPISAYLPFPPRTAFVPHPSFAWGWFAALSLPAAGAAALYWIALARARPEAAPPPRAHFPWWGWLGLGLTAGGWFLAWHEGALPPEWRRHAFTPLWLGYVLAANALAFRRSGRSLVTHRRGWLIALFPASVAFWWLFEHLNRFAGNWYYSGTAATGDWDYFVQASLPFSTVLPAVASTWAWLRQCPRLDAMALPALRGHAAFARIALPAGLLALGGVGIWPDALFPALWIAPLLVLWSLQELLLGETVLTPLQHGDWRPLLQPALAALICGLLWEFWNYGSVAKWHYSIPYVQRFAVFEMPLLGYAGYLPFGIECALVMDLVARHLERRALWPLVPR
jgi:hypothetical protein